LKERKTDRDNLGAHNKVTRSFILYSVLPVTPYYVLLTVLHGLQLSLAVEVMLFTAMLIAFGALLSQANMCTASRSLVHVHRSVAVICCALMWSWLMPVSTVSLSPCMTGKMLNIRRRFTRWWWRAGRRRGHAPFGPTDPLHRQGGGDEYVSRVLQAPLGAAAFG